MSTTRAAVVRGVKEPWEIVDLDLDEPNEREVLIRLAYSGLCQSDRHFQVGDFPARFPLVGGHEGAGVVEKVGPGVTRVAVGDHVVCSFLPVCGTCHWCSTGHQALCDLGLNAGTGQMLDGTFRFHHGSEDLGGVCALGTFSEQAVISEYSCVKVDSSLPLDVAALLGCGVPTGWGAAVYAAGVRAGDVVVIYGSGGVGSNAVQGAARSGASIVAVVDPVPFKREMAETFGATHTFATHEDVYEFIKEATWGRLANHAIITVTDHTVEITNQATSIVGKVGSVIVVATGRHGENQIEMNTQSLKGFQQRIQGVLFGNCNPLSDIPRLADQYKRGELRLDELITRRYRLGEINQAFEDLAEGKNIRGVIEHS
ncbi:NDMA-dependent alcohol dehydrogenase [Rhodococcus opacus]|uniref:NDMA-dependent alcohol dehydrogenase n=1 Tax=Rhodococcus opacus TaxID=37919 RepID=UPI00146BB313|nr:NDMA-dependent alcohol dehydrogenase [Rhodococcus opacus]